VESAKCGRQNYVFRDRPIRRHNPKRFAGRQSFRNLPRRWARSKQASAHDGATSPNMEKDVAKKKVSSRRN
jgi:hypothetical protein